jgi:hypothetical protein
MLLTRRHRRRRRRLVAAVMNPEQMRRVREFAGALGKLKAKQEQGLSADLTAAEVDGLIWGIKNLRAGTRANVGDKLDVVMADGQHLYWSTHCRHERHEKCNATELAPGVPRVPAECKTCSAPCICKCHDQEGP